MIRRDFLKLLGLSVPALRNALAQTRSKKTLITIFLRGGVDGLSMVQPTGDTSLAALRPGLLHGGASLDGFFSLHPAMKSLLPLYESKQLAVLHAVGQASASRSHFEAQDFIESGLAGMKRPDGFLNRALEAVPGDEAFRAVAVQNALPRSLAGDAPALAFPSLAQFRVGGGGGTFESLYAEAVDEALRTSGHEAFESLGTVKSKNLAKQEPQNGAQYPKGALGKRLADLARLIHAHVGLRIGVTEMTGFDTHLNQGADSGQLANRLAELGDALAAFATDLGPKLNDVVVVTMTEFGRTARENGTRGTDHGTASASFVLGGGVKGGRVVAQWPGLSASKLFENRDLAVTTDLRSVLAEAIAAAEIPAKPDDVFPEFKPARVGLYK
ncbi:MAG: transcriptional initiation protein Tat [Archangium gephyra]|uniref:Transcriptional initiation protein Tat n=1 Tax=Archangium gephyra TaxID=48 RepID=A0A2W5TSL7_9BACT|nr:MAG: transcriptional initiation protein Tat [Archangium gephyra]